MLATSFGPSLTSHKAHSPTRAHGQHPRIRDLKSGVMGLDELEKSGVKVGGLLSRKQDSARLVVQPIDCDNFLVSVENAQPCKRPSRIEINFAEVFDNYCVVPAEEPEDL